jgi:hypothetical protein
MLERKGKAVVPFFLRLQQEQWDYFGAKERDVAEEEEFFDYGWGCNECMLGRKGRKMRKMRKFEEKKVFNGDLGRGRIWQENCIIHFSYVSQPT